MKKIKEWTKRYLPAELVSITTSLLAAYSAVFFTISHVSIAYAATLGENLGFYGTILGRELFMLRRKAQNGEKMPVLKTIRNLSLEFGPGEILDLLLIRPGLMYLFYQLYPGPIGILLGKFSSDILFYIPVILGYEASKKLD